MCISTKSWFGAIAFAICVLIVQHFPRDVIATDQRVAPQVSSPKATSSVTVDQSGEVTAPAVNAPEDNFRQLKSHLQTAREVAALMPGYSAILTMQEEVSGTLRPVDRIEFKTRRDPFSVYMRWDDSEQEALYVHGENDNRLIVKPTRGLAAIRRVWRLEPDCRMAKQNCRYPITDAGIEKLVIRIQEFYGRHDDWSTLASFDLKHSMIADRNVVVVSVKFLNAASVPDYSESRFCFDVQTKLLTSVDNFAWPLDGERRLLEHYGYEQIVENSTPHDVEFSEENPAYRFVASVPTHGQE